MHYDLVGIGNALVDIEVQVDDVFIENRIQLYRLHFNYLKTYIYLTLLNLEDT